MVLLQVLFTELKLLPLESLGLDMLLLLLVVLFRLSHSLIRFAAVSPHMIGISMSNKTQSTWIICVGLVRKSRAS